MKTRLWKKDGKCDILLPPEILLEVFKNGQKVRRRLGFTSPDPYAKCASLSDARHKIRFDEEGHIIVKNPSACWLPDMTIQREIDGTIYSVTGSYDGSETLDEKLTRMMEQDAKNLEESE